MGDTRYDVIGAGYALTRREDPRIAALIHAALVRVPTSRATDMSWRLSQAR
jgi:hypothetical protein